MRTPAPGGRLIPRSCLAALTVTFPVTLPVAAAVTLAGCHPAATPVVAVGAAEVASVAVFGKGSVDMLYSAVTGKDCSIVRLDKGESYCKPKRAPPPAEPFCTRTLGMAQCFSDPASLPDHPMALGDTPRPPLALR